MSLLNKWFKKEPTICYSCVQLENKLSDATANLMTASEEYQKIQDHLAQLEAAVAGIKPIQFLPDNQRNLMEELLADVSALRAKLTYGADDKVEILYEDDVKKNIQPKTEKDVARETCNHPAKDGKRFCISKAGHTDRRHRYA